MKRILGLVAAVVVAAWVVAPLARSAHEPSAVASEWELEFQHQGLQAITVNLPGEGSRTFWYMLYTVTNRTGEDRTFIPSFVIYTDRGQLIQAGKGVPPVVFRQIQARHNNPLLRDAADMVGRLLQGKDNAKDGVAIFSDIPADVSSFDLFVGSLSGEMAVEKLPVAVEIEQTSVEGQTEKVTTDRLVLRKTLDLMYRFIGEPAARASTPPKLVEPKWVMR